MKWIERLIRLSVCLALVVQSWRAENFKAELAEVWSLYDQSMRSAMAANWRCADELERLKAGKRKTSGITLSTPMEK